MRTFFGLAVLVIGVGALGLWANGNQAKMIESKIGAAAEASATQSIHKAKTEVSGRDIKVSGLADSEAERDAIVAALNNVSGRRVVVSELKIIEKAAPYRFSGTKTPDKTSFEGNVPTAASRAEFHKLLGGGGSAKLHLASGMPDEGWPGFVGLGANALSLVNEGNFEIEDGALKLTGIVDNPAAEAKVREALAKLPSGYSSDITLKLLDDGKPAAILFDYNATEGARVSGKAPASMGMIHVAGALGLTKLGGKINASTVGGSDAIKARLTHLGPWISSFETLKFTATEAGAKLEGELAPGSDQELILAELKKALGETADIALSEATFSAKDGAERENAATGEKQVFRSGFWLPAMDFGVSRDACNNATTAIMRGATINFVTGSARLGPRAVGVINRLAATLNHCLSDATLSVEVGGHTDSQGNDASNLALSVERAKAVTAALSRRGVSEGSMSAKGYGETQPIADNATDEGRAKNRRTTFTWFQN